MHQEIIKRNIEYLSNQEKGFKNECDPTRKS